MKEGEEEKKTASTEEKETHDLVKVWSTLKVPLLDFASSEMGTCVITTIITTIIEIFIPLYVITHPCSPPAPPSTLSLT